MRQYQLRCCTSARRKMTRPGLSSSLSVRNVMRLPLCRNCVGFPAKALIRRSRAANVQIDISKKHELCQMLKK